MKALGESQNDDLVWEDYEKQRITNLERSERGLSRNDAERNKILFDLRDKSMQLSFLLFTTSFTIFQLIHEDKLLAGFQVKLLLLSWILNAAAIVAAFVQMYIDQAFHMEKGEYYKNKAKIWNRLLSKTNSGKDFQSRYQEASIIDKSDSQDKSNELFALLQIALTSFSFVIIVYLAVVIAVAQANL